MSVILPVSVVICLYSCVVYGTLGSADMDVAATLASLGNARSSATLSERERKLLKIRYRQFLNFCM